MAAYPRKQTVVIFILCALAVGVIAFYVYGGFTVTGTSSGRQSGVATAAVQNLSTSNVDWQKQFLGAAANTSAFKATGTMVASKNDAGLTAVDDLGRNFFTKYAELRQSGLTTDPQTVNDAMGQVASQAVSELSGPKVYSLKDIVIGGNSRTVTSAYGNAVVLVFRDYMPKQNEAVVAQQAFDDNDMSELAQINPIISSYKDAISLLIKIPTPQPLAQYHVNLINGLSIALYNAESFRHVDTDPVRGLAAVGLEMVWLKDVSLAIADIQNYFIGAGIPFGV